MKKQLLQKQRGILLALLCFLCVISINAQTLLYSNDFESGVGTSTIVGNGVIEASGDAAHGQVFHNNPANTNAVRTNYLQLPSTIFSEFQTSGSQGLTVSFWVNKSNATDYFWSPMFGAYGAAPIPNGAAPNTKNVKPAFTLMARSNGLVDFDYDNNGTNYGYSTFNSGSSTGWLDVGGWHFYTFTITPTTGIVYVDGVVKNQWPFTSDVGGNVGGLFHVASLLQYITLGGNQAYDWGDRDPAFQFDKLKIYADALTRSQIYALMGTDDYTSSNVTASIVNPSFEATNTDPEGWTWTGTNGPFHNAETNVNATDGTKIAGAWQDTFGDVELSQTITGLTNGIYTVTADLMGSSNGASRLTTQRLFANGKCMLFGPSSAYSTENLTTLGATEQYSFGGYAETWDDNRPFLNLRVTTAVTDGNLTLGIRTNGKSSSGYTFPNLTGGNGYGWFKVDNFTLTYVGATGVGSTPPNWSDVCVSGTRTIDQNITVHNLTINSDAKVTLSSGKTLAVTGNVAINSDATLGTGTYIDNGTTTTTNVTVQQYLTGANASGIPSGRCWYLTTPVVGSTSNAFTPATNRLWSYNEAQSELGLVYTRITETNVSLDPGTGYVARMAASGNISLAGTSLFNDDNKTFTNLSCVSADPTKQGFNLIGNPYPCYLDITSAFNGITTFETSAWYRSSSNGISNVFDTFNAFTGDGITNNSGVNAATLAKIPPMQAFWVRATNATNSLTFSKSMRSHKPAENGNNLRSATTSDVKQIRLNVSNGSNTDQTLIGFYAQAMDEFDNCDSRKMFNGVANLPEIYSLAGSTQVAINGLPLLTDTREIELGFKTAQAGTFSIKAAEILNLEADQTVILKDKQLNVSQNLTEQPVYNFSSDAVTTTTRFSVVIGKMATALKLAQKTSFDVRALNNGQMEIALDGATQASVKVFDTVGKQVFTQDILSQTSPLSKTFSKGVYLVKVSIGGVENTKKVVINL